MTHQQPLDHTITHTSSLSLPKGGVHYQRKYYLIRKLKAEGYKLEKADGFRTILVPLNLLYRAEANSTIKELRANHQFRVRIVEIEPEAVQAELAFQQQNKRRYLTRKRAIEIINTAINIMRNYKEKQTIKQQ